MAAFLGADGSAWVLRGCGGEDGNSLMGVERMCFFHLQRDLFILVDLMNRGEASGIR